MVVYVEYFKIHTFIFQLLLRNWENEHLKENKYLFFKGFLRIEIKTQKYCKSTLIFYLFLLFEILYNYFFLVIYLSIIKNSRVVNLLFILFRTFVLTLLLQQLVQFHFKTLRINYTTCIYTVMLQLMTRNCVNSYINTTCFFSIYLAKLKKYWFS